VDIVKGNTSMYMRKIVAAAGFACGAAMAFAPFAQAAPVDPVDPSLVSSTLDNEIATQNAIFEFQSALSGVTDLTKGGPGVYDSVTLTDVPHATTWGEVTPLEYQLYGANPIVAGISSGVSGPFNEYNGALTEFYDAYNVGVYAAANNGALDTNPADYLGNVHAAFATVDGQAPTVASAEEYFFNYGLGDLKGYDAIFAPNAADAGDIHPTLANEIVQLNNLFELDGKLAGVFNDIAPHAATPLEGTGVTFDTIDPSNLNATFDSLVFGAAGPTDDPGSYDIFNGAISELFNATNVETYSLLNGGELLPVSDIIGNLDLVSGTGDTVTSAVSGYLQQAIGDLAGYFLTPTL
jgi:hypothetical protein